MLKKTYRIALMSLALTISILALMACSSAGSMPPTTVSGTKAAGSTAAPGKTAASTPGSGKTMASVAASAKETDKSITIKDPELEKVIRKQLSKPEGTLTTADMQKLKAIRVDAKVNPVKYLDGLEYAINLGSFSYSYGTVASLDPLTKLNAMTYLTFSYAKTDQAPTVFDTPKLDRVNFIETNISDFSFLKNAPLSFATFTRSGITRIDFLRDKKLLELNLSDNKITDITPLKDKSGLKQLNLHKNQVSNISVLSTCTALQSLNISYNSVSNIAPIMQLPALKDLTAYEALDKKIIDRGLIQTLIAKGVEVDYHK